MTFMPHESMTGTPTGTILITGHSLGAAVATLAMYMLYPGGKERRVIKLRKHEKTRNCQRKIDYLESLCHKPFEHTSRNKQVISSAFTSHVYQLFYVRVQQGHFAYMNQHTKNILQMKDFFLI